MNCVNDDGVHHDRDLDRYHVPNGCDDLAMVELTNDGDAFYCATTNAIVAIANVIVAATIGTPPSLTSANRIRDHHVRHSQCRGVHV